MRGQERGSPVVVDGDGVDLGALNWLGRLEGGGGVQFGGFSNESEHDLAAMVSDFLENGSIGAESWCSSDSDSGFSGLARLADKILLHKHSMDQLESDLLSVVHSSILFMKETRYQLGKPETCNARCIRFSLVKLLKSSGYDAAVCVSKWQGHGKIPGGEHEYIDIITPRERLIVDIDFRSHFEIARAVTSYNVVLHALPPVYVGSITKLKFFLQTMVEAAKYSLNLNSMPLPPWRSLAYLEAKWESTSQRVVDHNSTFSSRHVHCLGLLRKLKSCIESDMKAKGLLIPVKETNEKQRIKKERWRRSLFRSP